MQLECLPFTFSSIKYGVYGTKTALPQAPFIKTKRPRARIDSRFSLAKAIQSGLFEGNKMQKERTPTTQWRVEVLECLTATKKMPVKNRIITKKATF